VVLGADPNLRFEFLAGLRRDQSLPIEWLGAANTIISGDSTVAIEWLAGAPLTIVSLKRLLVSPGRRRLLAAYGRVRLLRRS